MTTEVRGKKKEMEGVKELSHLWQRGSHCAGKREDTKEAHVWKASSLEIEEVGGCNGVLTGEGTREKYIQDSCGSSVGL